MEYRESLEDWRVKNLEEIARKVAVHRKRLQSEYGFLSSNDDVSATVVWPLYQMTISANAKHHRCVRSIEERVVKVTFILSPQDNTLPFLIITKSSYLSMWEAEFSQRKSDINIVVYKGNKDVRAIIRCLEFYNEDGCLMFQVLLSTPETVLEVLLLNHVINVGR
ncbi:hypothetical protein Vadar_032771 [Vaccinium darrowii]|uniref:Uncharacterized protein n=1 Tax=Vaccinium darrowii TaxID=229202 RepID=A0ACB7Y436_9ERIC|nr:hypothetical protein Vadar_032771 [Vaccinium darrowii]